MQSVWDRLNLLAACLCSRENGLKAKLISNSVGCFHWNYASPGRSDSEHFTCVGEQLHLEVTPLTSAGPWRLQPPVWPVRHPNSEVMAHCSVTVDAFLCTSPFLTFKHFSAKSFYLHIEVRISWSHMTPREGVWREIPNIVTLSESSRMSNPGIFVGVSVYQWGSEFDPWFKCDVFSISII